MLLVMHFSGSLSQNIVFWRAGRAARVSPAFNTKNVGIVTMFVSDWPPYTWEYKKAECGQFRWPPQMLLSSLSCPMCDLRVTLSALYLNVSGHVKGVYIICMHQSKLHGWVASCVSQQVHRFFASDRVFLFFYSSMLEAECTGSRETWS